jgi:peptidoglycan hydrolase-like protein with peptidoglycan-binding domain
MRSSQIVVAIAAALAVSAFAAENQVKQPRTQSANEGSAHSQPAHAQSQPAEVVRQVQQRLNHSGIDVGTVDGRWSLVTEKGVKKFQEKQGMVPTGQLDPQTLSALGVGEQSSSTGSSSRSPAGGSSAGSSNAPPLSDPAGAFDGPSSEGGRSKLFQ